MTSFEEISRPVTYLHDHHAKLAAHQAIANHEDILADLDARGGIVAEAAQKIRDDAYDAQMMSQLSPEDAYSAVEEAILDLEQQADGMMHDLPIKQRLAHTATHDIVQPAPVEERGAPVIDLTAFRARRER